MSKEMNETEKLVEILGLTEIPEPTSAADAIGVEDKARERRAKYESRLRELAKARRASQEAATCDFLP